MANEKRSTGWHGPLDRFTPGQTLRVGRDGEIDVPIDPTGPLYFTNRGLNMRVDPSSMALTTGSPVKLTGVPAPAADITTDAVEGAANVADGLRRLAALIAATQAEVDIAETDIGALNSLVAAIVSSPIRAKGTTTLSGGSKTVSTANVTSGDLIFLTYGATSGTPGALSYDNIVDSTSFDITSSTGILDDSEVVWMVVSP